MLPLQRNRRVHAWRWLPLMTALALAGIGVHAQDASKSPLAADPLGVTDAQLGAQYWIDKLAQPNQRLLGAAAIQAQNQRLRERDPTWNDLEALPQTLEAERIRAWIEQRSQRPDKTLYDEAGKEGSKRQIDKLVSALDLDAIPQTQVSRFGMLVRRANLRTFPTHLRVFTAPGDTDIDRFQETALVPGTPVLIAHDSRDRQWWFVVSPLYTGWIEKNAVAEGTRRAVFGYVHKTPMLVVTGAVVRSAHVPNDSPLSELPLEMGTTIPLLADAPRTALVSGQLAYSAWPVELPVRSEEGQLAFSPALVPRGADVATAPLPLTRANLLRQAFKFLGERYGWGNDYNARDCSGFVAAVYASMGVLMPRNTSDQARSPAFDRIAFDDASTQAQRDAAIGNLQVGDLVYIPGHVMMVIGRERGQPWVIHDVQGVTVADGDGQLQRLPLNSVSVTPLLPLRANADQRLVDRMTAIVRMRAPAR